MIARIARCALVLSLLIQLGAHLVVAQTYAWTTMAISHLRTAPVGAALSRTFDGQHPCHVCIKVQKDAQSRKNTEAKSGERTLDFTTTSTPRTRLALVPLWPLISSREDLKFSPRLIDVPPPRGLLA